MEFNATIIVAFISFVAFIFIMNFMLYKPINKIVSKRQKLIDENYEIAKTNISKSKVILSQREETLDKAKASSREEISKSIEDANSIKNTKLISSKKEARNTIEENKNLLNETKNNAIEPLKNEVVVLAQSISDKILKNHEKIENVDNEFIEKIIQG